MPSDETENTESHTPEYTKSEAVYVAMDHRQKQKIKEAVRLSGVAAAAKGRELLLEWAARVIKEEGHG